MSQQPRQRLDSWPPLAPGSALSSGQETATIDTNGLHITYSYDSGGDLTKITDPYGNITT